MPGDAELHRRGMATAVAAWETFARGTSGAAVVRAAGVAAAVFPSGPEGSVYNNAVIERGLDAGRRAAALDAMEAAYARAGVARFAAWAHESDAPLLAELARRGYRLEETTRSLGMALGEPPEPRPRIELGPADWSEHVRLIGMPAEFLSGIDRSGVHVLVAALGGESVATAIAFDHDGDCGIYNLGTRADARRRGLGTALTALHLDDARGRGCRTASVQSTPMAERLYARLGFRDLGRILEHVPA